MHSRIISSSSTLAFLLAAANSVQIVNAFVHQQQQQQHAAPGYNTRVRRSCIPRSATSSSSAAAANAIATFDASQRATVERIAAAIPDLSPKPDRSWGVSTATTIGGCLATLDARDAPGPANIAWMSSLCIESKLSALTIFNGPLTDVPHLLSRCAVLQDDTTLSLALDFRPRAYGAYEMKQPDGSYPGPDVLGRQAFEYSGARRDFESKFAVDQVVAFMASTAASMDGGSVVEVPATTTTTTESDRLTRGPLALYMTMPLTDANVAAVTAAREMAASYWLGWATDKSHCHKPGAPVNSQYVYDSKYKQNAYLALLPIYTEMYGPQDGATLAAADSGPLDEGYVGGGS